MDSAKQFENLTWADQTN